MGDKLLAFPKNRLFSQWLLAPLLILSLAFHVLILIAPVPDGSKAAPKEDQEETPPKDEVVDILSISKPEQPTTTPQQAAAPATPPPSTQAASPQAPVPVNPDKLPPPQEKPPTEEAPAEESFQNTPPEAPPTAPAFDPQQAQQQFSVNLGNLGLNDYTDSLGLPTQDHFRNPEAAGTFLANASGNPSPLPGTQARWLDKEPDTVLQDSLVKVYGAKGINFNELTPYGGERFFQALTPEGQPFLYISLVQLKGSTLMVIWTSPPPGASL